MEINKKDTDWFKNWFNSPYYHILYKNRDENEAKLFISNLIDHLKPVKNDQLLDIACGKGRHAILMNKLGFNVDAYDLAKNSIDTAKKFETNNLRFYVNDIREPLKINHYNYAFNLFTSFGYFVDETDNFKAIKAIADSLTKNGVLVLDFMNVHKVIKDLIIKEDKTIDGIQFSISKTVEDGFIVKNISFTDKGKDYSFHEKVKAITLDDFKSYFNSANLSIQKIYGDYNLQDFDIKNSDRLILITKK